MLNFLVIIKCINERPPWMPMAAFRQSVQLYTDQKINCRGCNRLFVVTKPSVPSLEFFVHCIKQCPEYNKLKFHLISVCETCDLKFLNQRNLSIHESSCHRDQTLSRSWMTPAIPTSHSMTRIYDLKKWLGCGKEFPALLRGPRLEARMDYHIHCIEECDKYQ